MTHVSAEHVERVRAHFRAHPNGHVTPEEIAALIGRSVHSARAVLQLLQLEGFLERATVYRARPVELLVVGGKSA